MHELAFGAVISMPRSTRRRDYTHLRPLSSSRFAPVDLQAFPTFEFFLAQFLVPFPPPPLLPEGCEVCYWLGSWDRDTNPRTPASPLPVDTLDPPRSGLVPPPLVFPAVKHAAPPLSPGTGIVPLVADCLTQLSGGLVVTPATISSPAAVPALRRHISTPGAQLATLHRV